MTFQLKILCLHKTLAKTFWTKQSEEKKKDMFGDQRSVQQEV